MPETFQVVIQNKNIKIQLMSPRKEISRTNSLVNKWLFQRKNNWKWFFFFCDNAFFILFYYLLKCLISWKYLKDCKIISPCFMQLFLNMVNNLCNQAILIYMKIDGSRLWSRLSLIIGVPIIKHFDILLNVTTEFIL